MNKSICVLYVYYVYVYCLRIKEIAGGATIALVIEVLFICVA